VLFVVLAVMAVITVVGAGTQLARHPALRTAAGTSETILSWYLPSVVGIVGIFSFAGHAFLPGQVAAFIGWETSPFQFEVAIANLTLGVLGLLCLRWRGGFWLATGIGEAIWLVGDALGHLRDMAQRQNYAPGNAGSAYSDLVVGLLTLVLVVLYSRSAPSTRTEGSA
jgi:uncharacterized protein DUF6790